MFALFFSLYISMFTGRWTQFNTADIKALILPSVKELGTLITSIFGDAQMTDFGSALLEPVGIGSWYFQPYLGICAFVLALITSIGIVVMAVKGVKRAFGIFFMGIRR